MSVVGSVTMRQKLDIEFVKIKVMRRNLSKFNELTPLGWTVVCGIILVFVLLTATVILLVRG